MVRLASRSSADFSETSAFSRVNAGSSTARFGWITATLAVCLASLTAVVGCGGEGAGAGAEEGDDVQVDLASTSEAAIFGGLPDAELQSGVVAVRVGQQAPYEICSGALIAPNVVLTARHCVSEMVAKSVICTDRGESANGPHVGEDHPVSTIQVFAGERPDFHGASSAVATSIVHVAGSSLCNSDIALIVLDRAPQGARPLPVRLGKSVQPHESVRAIGYGKSDMNDGPGTRMRRDDVNVLEVGAKLTASDTALGDKEFEVGRSICQGDSGGPSISEATGAVVGVVSRGADCRQDFGHVYTQTSGFEPLFALALETAGTSLTHEDGHVVYAEELSSAGEPASEGAALEANAGCSMSRTASPTSGGRFAFVLGALGLAFFARRRRAR
jgi:MYXO-CTERM domain-containing protein